MKAILLTDRKDNAARVYGEKEKQRIRETYEMADTVYSKEEILRMGGTDADAVFSTWGMPRFEEDEIVRFLPHVRAVYYAAGSVQGFAAPFLARGVAVFSAWRANAVPVAEFTAAEITLAAKGAFTQMGLIRECRALASADGDGRTGLYDITVGLLGLGAVGSLVAERLKGYDVNVIAFDPFCGAEKAEKLGVRLAALDEVFRGSEIVSNHLANLPETKEIIRREHLFSMKPGAVFINTGRGAQLNEGDLYDLLTARRDVTALLDVLIGDDSDSSPLRELPNCFMTPHIAGSIGQEVRRMAVYMARAAEDFAAGRDAGGRVTEEMLKTMA